MERPNATRAATLVHFDRLIGHRYGLSALGLSQRNGLAPGQCDRISHDMAHTKADALTRTNVTLPASLLAQVDRLAGPRGRSRYVAEAVAQRVRRDALGAAIRETAGAMVGRPGWMSPEEVTRWIDELRSEETD